MQERDQVGSGEAMRQLLEYPREKMLRVQTTRSEDGEKGMTLRIFWKSQPEDLVTDTM